MPDAKLENPYRNFRTGETDWLSTPPDDWCDYIPQWPSALALYELYQKADNMTPIEAAKKVLIQCVPKRRDNGELDPMAAFGEWAAERGYNLDDHEQRKQAITAFGGGE